MTRVWLGVGSNVDRERHLRVAITALGARFGALVISPVYDSAAVGFDGQPFLNLVVGIDTDLPVGELAQWLRALEAANGRTRETGTAFNDRTLDIDILTWGDACGVVDDITLPRGEILRHAFVLQPLADVAPGEQHPVLKRPYRELLAERDFSAQPLRVVSFALP